MRIVPAARADAIASREECTQAVARRDGETLASHFYRHAGAVRARMRERETPCGSVKRSHAAMAAKPRQAISTPPSRRRRARVIVALRH